MTTYDLVIVVYDTRVSIAGSYKPGPKDDDTELGWKLRLVHHNAQYYKPLQVTALRCLLPDLYSFVGTRGDHLAILRRLMLNPGDHFIMDSWRRTGLQRVGLKGRIVNQSLQ